MYTIYVYTSSIPYIWLQYFIVQMFTCMTRWVHYMWANPLSVYVSLHPLPTFGTCNFPLSQLHLYVQCTCVYTCTCILQDDKYRITSLTSFPLSPQYVENLMTWIEKQIANEDIFPVQMGESPLLWKLGPYTQSTNLHRDFSKFRGEDWNSDDRGRGQELTACWSRPSTGGGKIVFPLLRIKLTY